MDENIKVGEFNTLKIERVSPHGLYLSSQNESEVLLPKAYVTEGMKLEQMVKVFIYTDSEDRVVATTLEPLAKLGDFAYLEVVDSSKIGYFVDVGLPKDIFVPLKEQKNLQVGRKYLFYIALDSQTNRLYASAKIGKFLKQAPRFRINREVEALIFAKTPLGYKAIVDNSFEGVIYANEVFEDIVLGTKTKAYIKKPRSDTKLDLSLQPIGEAKEEFASQKILQILKSSGGVLDMNYKSSPDLIKEKFNLSKKSYKKALTNLIELGEITVDENGMRVVSTN